MQAAQPPAVDVARLGEHAQHSQLKTPPHPGIECHYIYPIAASAQFCSPRVPVLFLIARACRCSAPRAFSQQRFGYFSFKRGEVTGSLSPVTQPPRRLLARLLPSVYCSALLHKHTRLASKDPRRTAWAPQPRRCHHRLRRHKQLRQSHLRNS